MEVFDKDIDSSHQLFDVLTMADSKFIWMDGTLTPYENAHVHVLSHSLHYGCAVFEGIRAYETTRGESAIFRAKEHYLRFLDSMKALDYPCHYSVDDLVEATRNVIRKNDFKECYVRPLAYINDTVRGLKLPDAPKVHIAIAAWNWGKYMGAEGQKNGIRVCVSTYRRADVATSLPFAKLSGGYLTSVLARREATKGGYDEGIMLDPQGFVAEGSGENLFYVKGGKLYTPPAGFILPGITRDSVIEIARHLGYEVSEKRLTRNELYLADELFFTGTAVELNPIREVDNHPIGEGKPGPISRRIGETFFQSVRGGTPEFARWLTVV